MAFSESDLRAQIAAGGNKENAGTPAADNAPQTITMRGRTVTLPPGIDAETVRATLQKRRSGGTLSAEEQALMRKVFAAMNEGENRNAPAADYRFGGDFWVVVQADNGATRAAAVRAGITDLDRVEIVSGLTENERVLILPSAHLVETQERLQQFINRRVGTLPGMGSR